MLRSYAEIRVSNMSSEYQINDQQRLGVTAPRVHKFLAIQLTADQNGPLL